jgi:hypothetical protein
MLFRRSRALEIKGSRCHLRGRSWPRKTVTRLTISGKSPKKITLLWPFAISCQKKPITKSYCREQFLFLAFHKKEIRLITVQAVSLPLLAKEREALSKENATSFIAFLRFADL